MLPVPAMTVLDPLTVGGALVRAADTFSDREALVYDGRRASYRGLLEQVVDCARGLIGVGVGARDHVGILMPNCWDYVVLYYATNLIGARAVLLNSRYRADDLAHVIPQSDISTLFVGGHAHEFCDYRPILTEIFPDLAGWSGGPLDLAEAPQLRRVIELGDDRDGPWPQATAFASAAAGVSRNQVFEAAAGVSAEDIGLMIFSSGTTSRPKACMLTHLSLSQTGQALAERFALTSADRVWDPLPLFHMSTILPLAACRAAGACFIGMGHFDGAAALKLIIAERPSVHYAGFPTIISAIVAQPNFADYDQSRLRINHVVGPPDLLRRYAALFPGSVPVNSYGLTEATGVQCYNRLDDPDEVLFETNGGLFDGMEAKIVDEAGNPVPEGEPGEIKLRGYGIFAGYYGDPAATAAAIDADGWLGTGDLGRIGAGGRLVYDGRLKDMLKIGGENVAAVELESFLMTHPGVRMAQVIGVPDDRLMEVAAAYIERHPGSGVTAEDIARHCLGRIASYKIPRYVRFVETWPMSATKVQKFELRKAFEPTGKIEVSTLATAG